MLFELDYAGQELCSHAYCVKEKYLGCFVVVTLCPYSAVFIQWSCPYSAQNLQCSMEPQRREGSQIICDMAISNHGVKFTILTNDKYVAARIRDIQ
jgi:hypothetical protein